ncbi:2-dehydropantoate 2-reductase [Methylocystis bryophila]|uniref:2-dehydropantoate 2-reductase n=1 Tax=Methylocystis bryophila TaxID=655015 RepID=A0A1W6N214_9HYPH|nr:2-dehydropantoate 2-reductase [Methylocystis bryophila]ARN83865.1 2-dehydropantoate 2-reductase [Methylocystis bryophila]BDV39494.1 2-dehydropantoate 2-reductase [Methylocystis bryophila]
MKICVIGAGAIGGLLAARLARAGEDISVVARGAQLAAIQSRGLTLVGGGETFTVNIPASDRIAELGPQDLLVLAVKAHQLAAVASELAPILGENTLVLTAQNGVPWWYFCKHGGVHEGRRLESVDPGGVIAAHLPIDRIIASVVYPSAEVERPGVIRLIEGDRFTLAEIDGARTERILAVSEAFARAGFKAPVASDLRAEIWLKLWGNLSFNPISALTHATLEDICHFAPTRALAAEMMREAQQVGEALSIRFRISLEKRIAGAEAVGAHKTSMLQDVESGRAIEIEALLGAVIELGEIVGVATPHLRAVYALTKLLAATLAREKGRLAVAPV